MEITTYKELEYMSNMDKHVEKRENNFFLYLLFKIFF